MSKLAGKMNISSLLQESLCYIGQALVFAEAEQVIGRLTGAQVNAKQIERVCHHYGQRILAEDTQTIEEQVNKRHYVSVDGVMYLTGEESWPAPRWKENKLGLIYEQDDRVQMSKQRTALPDSIYVSHSGECQDFITKTDYHLENLNNLVFIADGARWIWKWADKTYPESVQIVDFYHAKEHRCAFAKSYLGDEQLGSQWIEQISDMMISQGINPVIACLQALPRRKKSCAIGNKLMAYLRKNQHRMQYHKFIEKGLLIGSGAIESAHRDVLQERKKLSGQRWTVAGFQQMAQIRVVYKNKENHRITQLCKNAA